MLPFPSEKPFVQNRFVLFVLVFYIKLVLCSVYGWLVGERQNYTYCQLAITAAAAQPTITVL